MIKQKVAILGASPKIERYSYKALVSLQNHGHEVFLVSPLYDEINQIEVHRSLEELENIDTLTVYINASHSSNFKKEILKLNPKRIIFNPGSENMELTKELRKKGIEVLEACTLVLLSTNQF